MKKIKKKAGTNKKKVSRIKNKPDYKGKHISHTVKPENMTELEWQTVLRRL